MRVNFRQYIALLIVLSYIALSIANVTHYHHIAINTNLSKNVSESQLVQIGFIHSFFECPIHTTFNNLHNLTDLQSSYSLIIFLQSNKISSKNIQSLPSYLIYHSILLRAPPELLC